MADFQNYDWSPFELQSPIWIIPDVCVCLEGVPHPQGAFVISLRRSMVFGTGGHPATRAILIKLLHKELDERIRVVDFWCGSGLLGIVCAKFGCDVVHIDNNETAITEAIENGLINDCVISIDEQAKTAATRKIPKCDLLVTHQASLKKLKTELPAIHALLKSGGTFMLSGWKPSAHRQVKNQVSEFFEIEEVDNLMNWPIITARK
jgi:ribosomal protein L11 methylase PrmA